MHLKIDLSSDSTNEETGPQDSGWKEMRPGLSEIRLEARILVIKIVRTVWTSAGGFPGHELYSTYWINVMAPSQGAQKLFLAW